MDCRMKILFRIAFCLLIACAGINLSHGATRYALADGAWEANGNWTGSTAPACGDSLIIPAGITVSINTQIDYSACVIPIKITIKGTLVFQTGKKLTLPCNSAIYIYNGGLITPAAGGGGNSNLIDICNTTVWNAGQGPLTGTSCLPPSPTCNAFVLPVSLIYFNAHFQDKNVIVDWRTATEKDNDFFTVERSIDGINFQSLANIDGAGNSNSIISYSYIDHTPYPKVSYYRLKQTDYNGAFSYSNTVAVRNGSNSSFLIYPNPASNYFVIEINGKFEDTNGELIIADSKGSRLCLKKIDFERQNLFYSSEFAKLSPGMYVVTLITNDQIFKQKLVIE
jgi:hypothetical protein